MINRLLLLVFFSGCGTTLYDWGDYENSVYRIGRMSGDFNPDEEIDRLSRQVQGTLIEGKSVPPGLYMHIGYLYSLKPDTGSALKYFDLEKQAYPESAKFVDGILARLNR